MLPDVLLVTALFAAACIPLLFAVTGKKAKHVRAYLVVNLIAVAAVVIFLGVFSFGTAVLAAGEETASESAGSAAGLAFIGAGISTGAACIGGGIAVSGAASAALGAISENERLFGRSLIFVVLAEGIAIYGMLISLLILNRV